MNHDSTPPPAPNHPNPSAARSPRYRWLLDWASPWEYTAHAIRREVLHLRSEFQTIEILETEGWGRCLLLDGEVQSFETDEHIYHESLVHPAMLLHEHPRHVLVVGGGEGATLREVLRHRSVEQATMVDLDPQVIAAARMHLPTFHAGSFDDPRTRLHYGDGRTFIETTAETFDVIVIDVTNPLDGGPSYRLFTVEFYETVRRRLAPRGIAAIQSSAVTLNGLSSAQTIQRTIRTAWPHVATCAVFLPAYTTDWSFTLASGDPLNPLGLPTAEIDRRIDQRLIGPTRFYDGCSHHRIFQLPRYVRQAFAEPGAASRDERPMTESFPGSARSLPH